MLDMEGNLERFERFTVQCPHIDLTQWLSCSIVESMWMQWEERGGWT